MKVKDCSCPNNPQSMFHNFSIKVTISSNLAHLHQKSVKSYCKSIHEKIINKLKHPAIFFSNNVVRTYLAIFLQIDVIFTTWSQRCGFQNYTTNPKKEWHSILILYVHTCINATTGNIRSPYVKCGSFFSNTR